MRMLTKEQKIWKGENYSAKNGISWLFRQLVTELDPNNPRSKPSYNEVKRVVHLSCIKWFFFWSFLLVSVSLETFLAHNSTTFFNCFRLLGLASTSTDPSDNPQKKIQWIWSGFFAGQKISKQLETTRFWNFSWRNPKQS